jgi:hypothetical protein
MALRKRLAVWGGRLAWVAGAVVIAFVVLAVGTLIHECGHALAGIAFGARVERLNVLGLDLYPSLRFEHASGYFGRVWLDRSLPEIADHWMRSAGSLSTLGLALIFQAALWARPPRRRWMQLLVVGFCFSWLDVFWHTSLALLGWRSMMYAEAYSALVALGAPAWALSAAILLISGLLLAATIIRWRMLGRAAGGAEKALEQMGELSRA